jgi:shikimate kinase
MDEMKVILLGLAGTGKTAIGNILRERYNFPVLEADDEVLRQYNGAWPDEEELIDASFEETTGHEPDIDRRSHCADFRNTAERRSL